MRMTRAPSLKQLSCNLSLLTLDPWLRGCVGYVAVRRFCQVLQDTRNPARIGSRAGFEGPGA
jgi:hypothetical protein